MLLPLFPEAPLLYLFLMAANEIAPSSSLPSSSLYAALPLCALVVASPRLRGLDVRDVWRNFSSSFCQSK